MLLYKLLTYQKNYNERYFVYRATKMPLEKNFNRLKRRNRWRKKNYRRKASEWWIVICGLFVDYLWCLVVQWKNVLSCLQKTWVVSVVSSIFFCFLVTKYFVSSIFFLVTFCRVCSCFWFGLWSNIFFLILQTIFFLYGLENKRF